MKNTMENTMETHRTPVNKQAALFLSRKKRVETISEALEIFARKLSTPEVGDGIKSMMDLKAQGEDVYITIKLKIRRDMRTPDHFSAAMSTTMERHLGAEDYHGLT